MRVEGLAVAGREGGHPVRLGLALVLEEHVEVAIDHFPQNTVHPEDASAIEPARVVERVGGVPERGLAMRPARFELATSASAGQRSIP